MCLLIVLSRIHPDYPLVVAANRDELLERPAEPMAVLIKSSPRVLGGLDLLAGGTWLAVNEHGVIAGLTNGRAPGGRDASRRSRGELPLGLATHASAELAVDAFAAGVRPSDYNPAFVLVGDRDALFFIDVTEGESPVIEALAPGTHILENRRLGAPSAKVDNVRSLLAGAEDLAGEALLTRLRVVLADHEVPTSESAAPPGDAEQRAAPATAACVHGESYGTRWSGIATAGAGATVGAGSTVGAGAGARPSFWYSDGPPCSAPFVDATPLWSPEAAARSS